MSLPSSNRLPAKTGDRLGPPATRGWPLVGALPMFIRNPLTCLGAAQARYGDIYTLDFGFLRWIILNHPRHIEHVMIDNAANYRKAGAVWEILRQLLGNGLAVSEGEFWLRQRRMIQPHFHRQRLVDLTDAMVTTINANLVSWEMAAKSQQPFNVLPAFSAITMRVIARTLFGQALADHELAEVSQSLAYLLGYTMLGAVTHALPAWLPIPGARRYRQTIQQLDGVIYKLIAHERNAVTPSSSLLTMLLQLVDAESNERMSDQQLRDEVMNFFLAGYETTSLALTWTIHLLTQHPEIMQKVHSEVDSLLQGQAPTFADLNRLTYTRMVLQEALRMRPPAWWSQRTAVANDEIDGYAIPAGATVVTYIYGIHHNPNIWPDPEQFDPERFTEAGIAQQQKLAWIPFGAGQHQCIARDFAMMEAQLVLAMLLQRFTFAALPGQNPVPKFTTSLEPKGGLFIMVSQRAVLG